MFKTLSDTGAANGISKPGTKFCRTAAQLGRSGHAVASFNRLLTRVEEMVSAGITPAEIVAVLGRKGARE